MLALLAAGVLASRPAKAHDIPSDVNAQVFVKPDGRHLEMLIRVPLGAMRDIDFRDTPDNYLDVEKLTPQLPGIAQVWLADFVSLYENNRLMPRVPAAAIRLSLQSDRSFTSFEAALAHVRTPSLTNDAHVFWNQLWLDVLYEYPIESDRSRFTIDPRLQQLGVRVLTVVRFLPPGGAVRAFEFDGNPGPVELDPRWEQAAARFVKLGFEHILDGTDHLLFLLCLVIPFRRFGPLLGVVTAFTVAHSITLIASAYNLAPDALWFPPLIETLIAVSILYMALENIVGGSTAHRRWLMAFGFGLVHGFGFSFALRQTLQFAGSHMLTSLLSFNIGVELGQLLVLAAMIPALDLLFRYVVAERMGTIILSALVAHTAWHWMLDRYARLSAFHLAWPALNWILLASAMRWAMWILILAGAGWLVYAALKRFSTRVGLEADSAEDATGRPSMHERF